MTEGKCTWRDCQNAAEVPQLGATGEMWANLCKPHDAELAQDLAGDNMKKWMSSYVKAKGGAAEAARAIFCTRKED